MRIDFLMRIDWPMTDGTDGADRSRRARAAAAPDDEKRSTERTGCLMIDGTG